MTCSACRSTGSPECSTAATYVLGALADSGPHSRELFHAAPLDELIARGLVEAHGSLVLASRAGLEHVRVRRELDFDVALRGSIEEAP
jgi:hypothetical protein